MLFNSFEFIFVFLPALCFVFFIVQKNKNYILSQCVLLLFSLVFYAHHSFENLLLMVCSVTGNFIIGRYILKNKFVLFVSISLNLLLLGYFKYSLFIFENLAPMHSHYFTNIALPLGISFYTFQQIAYLVDSYHGNKREDNFIRYALFVTFFPHSIAGPLVQYREISTQLNNTRISIDTLCLGITIFFLGLFKKCVIADQLSKWAIAVFDASSNGVIPTFTESWFGSAAYSLQLYFDFSGYSDMALGLARIFNIRFPINFDSPYNSTSIIEFWRRWHITLSNFLRDYVYIPLGGNRRGTYSRYTNIMVTMILGGFWHGASWTFILWGMFHGGCLVINHLWRNVLVNLKVNCDSSKVYLAFSWLITIICVNFSWVLFRSTDVKSAVIIYKSMLGFNGISARVIGNRLIEVGGFTALCFVGAMFICLFMPNVRIFFKKYLNSSSDPEVYQFSSADSKMFSFTWAPTKANAFFAALLTAIAIIVMLLREKSEFLYFNF